MAYVHVNKNICDEIGALPEKLRAELVHVSDLSKRNPQLKQMGPLLAYLFVGVRPFCVAWAGTSSRFEGVRLTGQRKERAMYHSVACIPLPATIGYDSVFGRMVEQATLAHAEMTWPGCFPEKQVRSCFHHTGWGELARSLAMLLIEELDPLCPADISFRDCHPMFDHPTHGVVDHEGNWIGTLVANERGVAIQRDSEIRMANRFDWHPELRPGPYIKMSTEYNQLLGQGILRVRKFARHRHPLVVRFPHMVRSFAAALRFLKGSSKARLSIVEMAAGRQPGHCPPIPPASSGQHVCENPNG